MGWLRILTYCQGNKVELRSRNKSNFNKRFSAIQEELQIFNLNAVFDGEAVVLKEDGCSDFNQLLEGETECLVYYVFDLLCYNGHNVMDLPLSIRREILKSILPPSNIIRFSDHVDTNRKDLFELAKNHKIKGIVAKNKFSHYIPGIRTSQWLKIKTLQIKEALVAGLLLDTEKHGSGFSSLIIGAEENNFYK
jgi:bifunctional non-homologous end joining protein LigD